MDPVRLRQLLRERLKLALTARDRTAVAAFRSAIGAIDNAEAVEALAPARGPTDVRLGVGAADCSTRTDHTRFR
jgi:hypothetical protein